MARQPLVLLAAGGTGGHLFPAEALAAELGRRNVAVELVTDPRAREYAGEFPARAVHSVASATFGSRAPAAVLRSATTLGQGLGQGLALMRRLNPAVIVGFGGYPSLTPLAAAQVLGIPSIVHEQNAVMGRANRLLAPRAIRIATGFPNLVNVKPRILAKAIHVGNPIRASVLEAASAYVAPIPGGRIRLLAFGGSQGARIMSEIVPAAVNWLDSGLRSRLSVVQQARAEDLDAATAVYRSAGVHAEIAPFFRDLPSRMANAHLVIARSGASTIAELAVIGRPSILVPLPHSLDNDQLENARALQTEGGATLVPQSEFTPQALARLLTELLSDPQILAQQAAAAHTYARPDAAARLADLVLEVAGLSSNA
ncbi:undecaprenyldiphospho-muramoylpentapeptide beta-N-acetylglucosaminyltransferase [Terrihabitans sp. B22-R8]|uniref:undecaprenyldiphospho-muramoylpentapeptide beta-N-acetylglucosaminyltransferase n=1 Tax=Terrihabitans sp. B22-R8 TaxID=3425128 RepID=UPI00403CD276